MESTIKEIATVLRSTDTMAAQFAQGVQQRVKGTVSNAEILAVMKSVSAKNLSMAKVVAKLQRQVEKQ
jgi:hypothetical protein